MKPTKYASLALALSITANISAQVPDTTGIYSERRDTLDATVLTARQSGSYLAKGKEIRTEVITAAGLCKMACCNLAESFENSASVTVGYSDAVTGARQIRLLGQNGIYTQMLDENRPVMRGLSAPFGLNFVPGQWLESIQIAKGVTSVINGAESLTGQINLEHRKPTDEKPLFFHASVMDDSKCDLNVISSLQLDEMERWSTVILAHVDGNFRSMDMNRDGFMDDPRQFNAALSNRWLYYSPNGTQVRFGVRAIRDRRLGGQMEDLGDARWASLVNNESLNGYVKVGVPLNEDNSRNVALVMDATLQRLENVTGAADRSRGDERSYNAGQQSYFANLLYQREFDNGNRYTLGLSEMMDVWLDRLGCGNVETGAPKSAYSTTGAFGEFIVHSGDVFSAIVGLRCDYYNDAGLKCIPRLTLKWAPSDQIVLRANGGRGLRRAYPLVDNFGVLSSGRAIGNGIFEHPLEDAWTFGGNATWYVPFDASGKTYFSVDAFHTSFTSQMVVDYDKSPDTICLYTVPAGLSRTANLQLDFYTEPLKGLSVTLTGRFTDARQGFQSGTGFESRVKPMTSLYKGVLNVQYATNLNRWIFDFTASVNGPCRVWDFMTPLLPEYADGYTPAYPLLYAQVTKRFKGFDVYAGGENLTGYTQPMPIINASNPFDNCAFEPGCVWGPIMGAKLYAGVRVTLWKKE